jgi:hypothetical protein
MLQQKSTYTTPLRVTVSSEAHTPKSTHSSKRARKRVVVGPTGGDVLLLVEGEGWDGRGPVSRCCDLPPLEAPLSPPAGAPIAGGGMGVQVV